MAEACHPHGTLVLAGLGHCGGQGSSAYSQSVMWAPSRVADVVSREMPVAMEDGRTSMPLVAAFAAAARRAVASGLDGVEVDAGSCSLLRQFHSGLTNLRADRYGSDRLLLTTRVLEAVRAALGPDGCCPLRLCCDELAPWAGVTPEHAGDQVVALADPVDLVVVVRGGPFSASAYRPDAHTPAGFNLELCRANARGGGRPGRGRPAGQRGRPVDGPARRWTTGVADLVEMTRAQIAEPRLVALVRGRPGRPGPALHPLQPGLSCPGPPQSPGELRGGTPQRARDGRAPGRGNRSRRPGRS